MTLRITWTGPEDALRRADIVLSELLDPPADAASLVKDDHAAEDPETGWRLHAYFETPPEAGALAAALAAAGLSALGEGEPETLEDKDWVAHALEGLGVVTAGPFVVYGRHDADKAAGMAGHKILVEANRAFGTGHHPTTAGCLLMLAERQDTRPASILDLGTGSGLLAIAARRLWPEAAILGTDLDTPSVAIAQENLVLNGAPGIDVMEEEGVGPGVRAAAPYDLVMANILAEPLIALASAIAEVLAPGGEVMLAGLLARQEDAVTAAYAAEGLRVIQRRGEVWPILLLSR